MKIKSASNPFAQCPICSVDNDHAINKCTAYKTSQGKLARLAQLNFCQKCTHAEHLSQKCNYRFKKSSCFCNGWHFSFLCPNSKNDCSGNPKPCDLGTTPILTNNFLTVSHSFLRGTNLDSVLSTLTCLLPGKIPVLTLRDSGSQSNFILTSLLSPDNHEVLKSDVKLSIDGFNSSTSYVSKLVRVNVKFGEQVKSVEFLTMDSFKFNLNLPKLSVIVAEFKQKGYILADQSLNENSDSIENVGMILGADAAYCFQDKNVRFGEHSMFYEAPYGVMLIGNIEKMIADLCYLPDLTVKRGPPESMSGNNFTTNGLLRVNPCPTISVLACNISNEEMDLDNFLPMPTKKDITDNYGLEFQSVDKQCSELLGKEPTDNCETVELNTKLLNYLFQNIKRSETGRIIMPLLWNSKVKNLLPRNFELAKSVLFSNIKKYGKNEQYMALMKENVKELECSDIIEIIPNQEQFFEENPNCSVLASMPIFRLSKESTKCRFVFLSNLCEKPKTTIPTVSHNQCMYSGPNLNQKLSTALTLLRFDSEILIFDIKKAYCQIGLNESDQNKMLFLWIKDLNKKEVVLYRNKRLTFGAKCAPTILIASLYYILIMQTENDAPRLKILKRLIYALIYVDNGAISMNSEKDIFWAYCQLAEIFAPYQMQL